jgi:uncharacterized protein with PIN domain
MGRIERGYEHKFRALLQRSGAGKPEERIERLFRRARALVQANGNPMSEALAQIFARSQKAVERWEKRRAVRTGVQSRCAGPEIVPHFLCDAGLGGLARWLRAAGYEARWKADIDDDALLREAGQTAAILVTTDSMLLERRLLRDGVIRVVWVPPSGSMTDQLEMVLRETGLHVREARCMECGGELDKADKAELKERIPPRTYRWLDEYFLCRQCGKLFWHGTHWERIRARLEQMRQRLAR